MIGLGFHLTVPFIDDWILDALELTVDTAIFRALASFGAIGTEGNLIVFPSKIVDALWHIAGNGFSL